MHWIRVASFGVATSMLGALAFAGCDADGNTPVADPGGSIADAGPDVVAAGGSDGGNSGPAGATGLGASCQDVSDCNEGLECVAQSSNAWGGADPAGGYCTLPCTANADCDEFEASAICYIGFCVASCTVGDAPAAKCGGRGSTVACATIDDVETQGPVDVCLPTCRSDADCGTGRFCDLLFGFCFDTPAAGDPIGTPCDPEADSDPCSGFCLPLVSAVGGLCSGVCTFGEVGCGVNATDTPAVGLPACVIPQSELGQEGDAGFCLLRCNCSDECANDDDRCLPILQNRAVFDHLGVAGFCAPPAPAATPDVPVVDLICSAGVDGGSIASDAGAVGDVDGGN